MKNKITPTIVFFLSFHFLTSAWANSASRPFSIEYASKEWNDSATQLDNAYMFVREKQSGKIAKVVVEENAPDSAIFSGRFSIDLAKAQYGDLEVYIPTEAARKDPKQMQRFMQELQKGTLAKQPTLIRTDEKTVKMDVYDTEDQLKQAQEIYQRELKAKDQAERTKLSKPLADEKSVVAAKLAEKAAELAKLNAAAAAREIQRLRLEQLAAQKRAEEQAKAEKMSAAAQEKQKALAKKYADQAMIQYRKSNFKEAEKFFQKATELDPANDSFYLRYGISLYRNEKMNEALVYTRMAKDQPENLAEKNYYLGLIHYRLNEYNAAIGYFQSARATKTPVIAASAAFYEGVAHMTLDNLEKAQSAFEWVLDNSDDAALDQKAEEFIEKIANLMMYKKQMARKWKINARFGSTYDSNILLTPASSADQSLGLASDDGGLRLMLQGEVERRLAVNDKRDWMAKASSLYMYSLDSQFNTADPWQTTVAAVRGAKGTTKDNKAYQWNLSPGVEILFMDEDDDGTRDNVSNGAYIAGDVTFIQREDYFASYSLELRKDDSQLDATGDDDADSLKYSLRTNHTRFLDKTKKRAMIGSLGYVGNQAVGDNETYNRIEAGATYAAPIYKWTNTIWSFGLAAYVLNYPDATDGRRDTNVSLTYSLNKTFSEKWSLIGMASYNNNVSNVDSNHYDKFSIMGLANYTWAQ